MFLQPTGRRANFKHKELAKQNFSCHLIMFSQLGAYFHLSFKKPLWVGFFSEV